jgi:CRP/FNR family cyclic AMP-dependent transcriptional regulator
MPSGGGRKRQTEHLRAVPEFRACSKKQLEEVARLADELIVHAGEILTKEGRIGREFFIILSGTASVTRGGQVVNTLGAGDYFGELAAIDPGPRNATVTAVTDLDVLIIGPREFGAMSEIPGFRDALLKGMARRLRAADEALPAELDQRAPTPTAAAEASGSHDASSSLGNPAAG